MLTWFRSIRENKRKRIEAQKLKNDTIEMLCWEIKMNVLDMLIAQKNMNATASKHVHDGLVVEFQVQQRIWSNISNLEFQECLLTPGGSLKKKNASSLPQGLLCFLRLRYGTKSDVVPYRENIIGIFAGREIFYEVNIKLSKGADMHTIYAAHKLSRSPHYEYLWLLNIDAFKKEYLVYQSLRKLGTPERTAIELLRTKLKELND